MFLREDYRNLEAKLNILAESNLTLLDQLGITSNDDSMQNSFLNSKINKSPVYSPLLKRHRYKKASPQRNVDQSKPYI